MMNRLVTVLLILLVLPVLTSAEIYKYRDKNGVLRFTDNLTEVPVSQRENIEQYREIKAPAGAVEKAPADAQPAPDPKAMEKELLSEKEILDNEYQQLMEMRSSIEAAPQPGTPEEIAAHEKKIKNYNAQLKIYEIKQKSFREKVAEYQKAAE
jgi:hypothetical protein